MGKLALTRFSCRSIGVSGTDNASYRDLKSFWYIFFFLVFNATKIVQFWLYVKRDSVALVMLCVFIIFNLNFSNVFMFYAIECASSKCYVI